MPFFFNRLHKRLFECREAERTFPGPCPGLYKIWSVVHRTTSNFLIYNLWFPWFDYKLLGGLLKTIISRTADIYYLLNNLHHHLEKINEPTKSVYQVETKNAS